MVSIWNRLYWGGDPDQQDDFTGLSKRDLYHIKRSWAVIYAEKDKYGMQIFIRLFRLNPATQKFFKTIQHMNEDELKNSFQFKAHVVNVMAALNAAVTNLHQPRVVAALMNKLGRSHHRNGIQTNHFDDLTTVLVDILQNDLKADGATVQSWARFVGFIYRHIFETLCNT